MTLPKKKVKAYLCGVDFQYEAGESINFPILFNSVKDLKKERSCYKECSVLEVELVPIKWVIKQDLFKECKPKKKNK